MAITRESYDVYQDRQDTHEHVVQFSENDASLISSVSAFIEAGLQAGDGCIVVSTKLHRESLERCLKENGLDVDAARVDGSYIALDAAEMLGRFMVNGEPDPARFTQVIGQILEKMARRRRRVRVFGEMVALLWAEGNRTATIRLEDLWNDLHKAHTFSLFCAYPMQSFDGNTNGADFTQICQQHSQVVPSESYLQLSEQERVHAFTLLQQKAHQLEAEIAEHKATQERLRMLAAIVESSDDAILSKDLDGIITSWNTAGERIYGYTAQEMIGQSVTRIFPPGQYEEFLQIMEKLRRGERIDHYQTRRLRKDGSMVTVSITISPVKDENGTIIGASDIAHDITQQQWLEAKSRQLFASNLIGIFIADATGTLLEANKAFLDLAGYTQEEWQAEAGQPDVPSFSVAQSLRPFILQTHKQASNPEPQETALQQKNGKILPVLVAVTDIEPTETSIGFVLDISERKALEQRKDEFIGMASHELKTPITSLKGFLGLLQRLLATQKDEKVLHYLARMDAQIDKLTQLINDLLDISRMQTGQLVYREERIEIDSLVQEIVENVQEATQTHHLRIEGQTHAEVFGDRNRLGQVITNLLNNATKYSPNADLVVVHLASEAKQVRVSVQDFGLGIAKAHHQKIFERFYQVSEPDEKTYPGLGIGLAISREIIKRHQGHIWVESRKGEGATFHLTLPSIQEKRKHASSALLRGRRRECLDAE